jgi:hypothetical protein
LALPGALTLTLTLTLTLALALTLALLALALLALALLALALLALALLALLTLLTLLTLALLTLLARWTLSGIGHLFRVVVVLSHLAVILTVLGGDLQVVVRDTQPWLAIRSEDLHEVVVDLKVTRDVPSHVVQYLGVHCTLGVLAQGVPSLVAQHAGHVRDVVVGRQSARLARVFRRDFAG